MAKRRKATTAKSKNETARQYHGGIMAKTNNEIAKSYQQHVAASGDNNNHVAKIISSASTACKRISAS